MRQEQREQLARERIERCRRGCRRETPRGCRCIDPQAAWSAAPRSTAAAKDSALVAGGCAELEIYAADWRSRRLHTHAICVSLHVAYGDHQRERSRVRTCILVWGSV